MTNTTTTESVMKARELIQELKDNKNINISDATENDSSKMREIERTLQKMRSLEDRGIVAFDKVTARQVEWMEEQERIESLGVKINYEWHDVLA